ncbi:ribose-5-phosphate isomerase RpiA [Chloroflexota bacterium]
MKNDIEHQKKLAAEFAVNFIKSGMVIGLGEGSTAVHALYKIAERIKTGSLEDIQAIPCSLTVKNLAQEHSIPLTTLNDHPAIDLTIDGADEFDSNFNLIKGGGGALLREKIVAESSKREIIVVDENKFSPMLGTKWPLPIEAIPFGWETHINFLRNLGGKPVLRTLEGQTPYQTDQGNYIIDCNFGPIAQPESLSEKLNNRTGIVEHGLFLGLATDIVIGTESGIQHLTRDDISPINQS